eukprot:8741-Heterococcus_DN1.PRE.2
MPLQLLFDASTGVPTQCPVMCKACGTAAGPDPTPSSVARTPAPITPPAVQPSTCKDTNTQVPLFPCMATESANVADDVASLSQPCCSQHARHDDK